MGFNTRLPALEPDTVTPNPLGYRGRTGFTHDDAPVDGILLTNLGTPDAPTAKAVRRYLGEFLWDPRVIETHRWLWWMILHAVILRIRPARSAAAYREVWTPEGSPLLRFSRAQRDAVARVLEPGWPGRVAVALGMRYGSPSIAEALRELEGWGVRRLLVLPLYPQYSATTTGSTFDAVSEELRRWRWIPELRFVTHYHDDAGYVAALAASIREERRSNGEPEHLLLSFHGLPRRYLESGDPYFCHCHKTARLIAETLELPADGWSVAFQSRVGRETWLEPYTEAHLRNLARQGVRSVQVICPGFSADCLETLEEIAMRARETFLAAGGSVLRYVPALNVRADHVEALAALVRARASDWLQAPLEQPRAEHARALGAPR
jgi:ferrochelatase